LTTERQGHFPCQDCHECERCSDRRSPVELLQHVSSHDQHQHTTCRAGVGLRRSGP